MSIDSPEHPFHPIRENLRSLESKLQQTEHWGQQHLNDRDVPVDSQAMSHQCQDMRGDVSSLCDVLGTQYRHVRQRTAAAELKQLRYCYTEIDTSIKHLIRRRHSIIEEIHQHDPAGAELVLRHDQDFCRYAEQHGYLRARQQHAGPIVWPGAVAAWADTTGWQQQLDQRRRERTKIQSIISENESSLRELVQQHDRTCYERNALSNVGGPESPWAKLAEELRRLTAELESLSRQIEADYSEYLGASRQLMSIASDNLRRMTAGALNQVWIADSTTPTLIVREADGTAIACEQLPPGRQDQIVLAVILAVTRTLADRGLELPLMLTDPLRRVPSADALNTAGVIAETRRNHCQTIVFVAVPAGVQPFAGYQPTVCELPLTTTLPGTDPQNPTFPMIDPARQQNWSAAPFGVEPRANEHINHEPLYRFPIQRPTLWPTAPAGNQSSHSSDASAPVQPVQFQSHPLSPTSELAAAQLFTSAEINALRRCNVFTIDEFLECTPEKLSAEMRDLQVSPGVIDRWQACCWLMVCIPGMRADDARALCECGISEPEQLDDMTGDYLLKRLSQHVGDNPWLGRRYGVDRINSWMRRIGSNAPDVAAWRRLQPLDPPNFESFEAVAQQHAAAS